ncbi:hypothetical protein LGQ03_10970 [Loktanella sp. TSTF-M6]|uniref:Uncharacterized protein n=1 Tax=Loktanella gaetbuli TaxID=2881335 RepID=A0ABS8BWE0_9RHOB|nr:hypothetical protein [Loktanella gaetbuli]MCB5199761.1 hypothetical protein [Loktanella gaetbuli]
MRLVALSLLGLSGVFAFLFHVMHVRWRDCFDAMGRCFDVQSGVVYQQQSGLVWGQLTAATFAGAIVVIWLSWKRG